MTAAEASAKLAAMTRAEYERCTAVMEHGTLKAAAEALDIDRGTVAEAWRNYRKYFAIILKEMRPDLQ